jgi:hypothetical protein
MIDPNGMKITDALWEQIDRLMKEINRKWMWYEDRINNLICRMREGGLTDDKIFGLNRRIQRLREEQAVYGEISDEIYALHTSSQVYDFEYWNDMREDAAGAANFNFNNGNFVIQMRSRERTYMLAHELKHAYQFEIGEYSVSPPKIGLYDKYDEVAAYERGTLFGGPRYTIKTLPDMYKDIPNGPIDITNHPELEKNLNNPAYLLGKSYQIGAFRVNGVTYFLPQN